MMRRPRVRLTMRGSMAFIIFVGLLLGWAAHRARLKWQTQRLIDQDITVESAEANFQNAGIAREAAETAVARYAEEHGGDDESPTLEALRAAAKEARRKELAREETWREERRTLSRLIKAHYDAWR